MNDKSGEAVSLRGWSEPATFPFKFKIGSCLPFARTHVDMIAGVPAASRGGCREARGHRMPREVCHVDTQPGSGAFPRLLGAIRGLSGVVGAKHLLFRSLPGLDWMDAWYLCAASCSTSPAGSGGHGTAISSLTQELACMVSSISSWGAV
jgi:hypothetical protein